MSRMPLAAALVLVVFSVVFALAVMVFAISAHIGVIGQ